MDAGYAVKLPVHRNLAQYHEHARNFMVKGGSSDEADHLKAWKVTTKMQTSLNI